MNPIVLLATLIVAAAANPILLANRPFVPIRSLNQDIGSNGQYSFSFDSAEESVSETGGLVLPPGSLEAGATKSGSFSYTSPEGQLITLNYIADENGFRATGDHLPTPPPMSEEIRAMIQTLPKLVEVEEPTLIRAAPIALTRFVQPAPVRFVHSAPLPLERVLVAPVAPEKMFVQTPEFLIDSNAAKTLVRIGN